VTGTLVAVASPTDVADARRRAAELCHTLHFDEVSAGRVAIVVSEAATNVLKHAGGGHVFVGPAGACDRPGVQVIGMDRGGGMDDVTASMADGYSTSGTSGTGLGAIRRAADTFDLHSGARGTVVAAALYPRSGGRLEPLPLGGICVPAPGELRAGDGWAAWSAGELTSVFVCDGLGHGLEAAAATSAAVEAFCQHAERSAADVIRAVHDRLKATRGAAVALAELDRREGTLRYCALGNISAVIARPDGAEQHLVSLGGIAGHVLRRLQTFTYAWPRGSVLVMHSDGIDTRWSLSHHPGLASRRPDVIAGVLFRDHRRGRDDATVVVVRNPEVA
jgi:anti-sigma regulatory factor (Ser/Thr protein kinase)